MVKTAIDPNGCENSDCPKLRNKKLASIPNRINNAILNINETRSTPLKDIGTKFKKKIAVI